MATSCYGRRYSLETSIRELVGPLAGVACALALLVALLVLRARGGRVAWGRRPSQWGRRWGFARRALISEKPRRYYFRGGLPPPAARWRQQQPDEAVCAPQEARQPLLLLLLQAIRWLLRAKKANTQVKADLGVKRWISMRPLAHGGAGSQGYKYRLQKPKGNDGLCHQMWHTHVMAVANPRPPNQ
jgi:hypothetical protein